MVYTFGGHIIKEKTVDDGTTGGKVIYQTEDGRWWEKTWYTQDSAPTGVTIGKMSNGKIWT